MARGGGGKAKNGKEHEPLIDVAEVLRMLDVSERQLYRLIRERDDYGRPQTPIPSVKVGSARKFYASEVRDWVRRTNGRTESG